MAERIVIKATEMVDYGESKRVPIDLSVKVPKNKRFAFRRGSMLLRLWRRRPRHIGATERARLDAEYQADYERWLTDQGFNTNTTTTESEGDALPPVGEDGAFPS